MHMTGTPPDDELQHLREKRMREVLDTTKRRQKPQVLRITDKNIEHTVRSHPFIVIDFWAEWCGPCKRVAPVVTELAAELAGKVTFGKCNTDQNRRSAAGLGISAIPALILFADGREVKRIIGAYPKTTILKKIMRAFGDGLSR